MVRIELGLDTLSVLIAGLYCTESGIDSRAVPQSVWLSIAEKLEYFIDNGLWNFDKISFEDWIRTSLTILPKELLSEENLEEIQSIPLYWEVMNGNVVLCISMDIRNINAADEVSD